MFLYRFVLKRTLNGFYKFYGFYSFYFTKYNKTDRLINYSKLRLTALFVYSIQIEHNAGKPQKTL